MEGTTHMIKISLSLICSTAPGLELHMWWPPRTQPLKLLSCLQLVYLPGEEPLLCPQPSGGVGSRAHRAPSELGHGHFGGRGEKNVTLEENERNQPHRQW